MESIAELIIPDTIEPIRGARAWRVSRNVAGLTKLVGYGYTTPWKRQGPLQAECKRQADDMLLTMWSVYSMTRTGKPKKQPPTNHRAPHPDCECGFWAFADPWDLPEPSEHTGPTVVGVVEMWGRVTCGLQGWRGEWARIVGLVPMDDDASATEKRVAQTYNVPILDTWPPLSEPSKPEPKEETDGHRGDSEDDRGGADSETKGAAGTSSSWFSRHRAG